MHVILRYRLPEEQVEFNAAMQGREAKPLDRFTHWMPLPEPPEVK